MKTHAHILDVHINLMPLPLINFRKFITDEKFFMIILKEENWWIDFAQPLTLTAKSNIHAKKVLHKDKGRINLHT